MFQSVLAITIALRLRDSHTDVIRKTRWGSHVSSSAAVPFAKGNGFAKAYHTNATLDEPRLYPLIAIL